MVVSIGVIHHIPDPENTLKAIHNSLAEGGKFLIWVYGHEGNELYLKFFGPIRKITTRLPHFMLAGLAHVLAMLLNVYIFLCGYVKLPMRDYMRNVLAKFTKKVRYVAIYDQLNPAYAKYYKEDELFALLQAGGFENIRTFHRHGYSWTAIAKK